MHIEVDRSDVEVAHQRKPRVCSQLLLKPRLKRIQPGKLVAILVLADLGAVGHIDADEASGQPRARLCCGERGQAALVIGKPGVVVHHIDDVAESGLPGENGHTVVGGLSNEVNRVAGCLDLGLGKFRIDELGLLQTKEVRLGGGQPIQNMWQANANGVDIPTRDPQGAVARGTGAAVQ